MTDLAPLHLRVIDDRDADGECPLCVETFKVVRFRWRCPSCRQSHVATTCLLCSHVLDFGAGHGEPHRVALVAALDAHWSAEMARVTGRSVDECRATTVAGDGPERHLAQLAVLAAGQ